MNSKDNYLKENNLSLRNRSGNITINNSKLTSFLYVLMRDHLSFGQVENLVFDNQEPDVLYTNGWLAKYAEDIANRLK